MSRHTPRPDRELRCSIAELSATDLLRLKKAAQFASRHLSAWNWEDLLQEALRRALEGSRVWPTHIPILTFLVQTMRSLAREQWEHEHRPAAPTDFALVPSTYEPTASADPERELAAAQELAEIHDWFADDAYALAVLEGMSSGEGPADIQTRAGLDERGYRAAQKRIRRIILKRAGENQ